MKLRLRKGYQQKLILLSKGNLTWRELSHLLEIPKGYLCNDLKYEKRLISEGAYHKMCQIVEKNFDKEIIQKLPDNWGKSLGGKNSKGSFKKISKPKQDESLAEFIGALLGDGNINFYNKYKAGVYQIKIAGDFKLDKSYHLDYLKPLCQNLFKLNVKEIINQKKNERFLVIYSKGVIEFLQAMGLKHGDKIKNGTTIPPWVYNNVVYIRACVRGLMDTDGSIFRMSRRDPHLLRLGFTNYNLQLMLAVKSSFEKLGYSPSLSKNQKNLFISRQGEIERYLKEIGFSNPKHLRRLEMFRQSKGSSPVV